MCAGRFVDALLASGHQVQVVRPRQSRSDPPVRSPNLEWVLTPPLPVPLHPGLQLGWPAAWLHRRWMAQRPDVVHIATEGPLGLSALRAALRLQVPLSSSFHTNFHTFSEFYGLGAFRRLGLAYLKWFHNRAACTMVPTTQTQDQLRAAGFCNLAVVPRGVDAQLYSPAKRSERLRHSWGATPDDTVVLYVGRLAPEKNVPLAIDAFARMRPAASSVRLVLVGDGPERHRLERAHPEIIFAGKRQGEDLAEHYASGDVFLFPSLTETFGNVTLEAMASGLAVVAYDEAAAHEHIRHLESGFLVAPGRAREFVDAAARLVTQPELVRRLREGAVRAARPIDWESVGRVFEDLVARIARSEAIA